MNIQTQQEHVQNRAFIAAKAQVDKLKKFYIHLFIYSIGLTIYILKTYFEVRFSFLPLNKINFLFIAIWTLIIGIRAAKMFLGNYFLGYEWEHNKLQEIMGAKTKNQTWQ